MIEHPTSPRSIICLQECGQFFLEELQNRLPERMHIFFSSDSPCKNQNIVIYDSNILELDKKASAIDFPFVTTEKNRRSMNLVFRRGEETYRVINVHVPGNPNLPGISDLATFVGREHREGEITLCTGDMNFNEIEVREAFDQAISEYSLISPYPTNVGMDFFSKCIDHFFIKGTDHIEVSKAEALLPNLDPMVTLLV